MTVQIEIPEDIVSAMRLPEPEIEGRARLELALAFYAQSVLTFAEARRLAGLTRLQFALELGRRDIPRQYTQANLDEDIAFANRQ